MNSPDKYRKIIDVSVADVKVDMGEWSLVSSGQSIATEGLGPCVGAAIYDPGSHVAYLAHTYGWDISPVVEMIDSITTQVVDVRALRAWLLGGCAIAESFDCAATRNMRTKVEQQLTSLGVAKNNIEIVWIDNPDEAGSMLLFAATGECMIEISDPFDDVTR